MLLHYYTLFHVATELRMNAGGAYCTACFTQEKNTLHLAFERDRREVVFECNLDSRNGALLVKQNFHRARKNTLDCFPELVGRTLTDVQVLPNERVLMLVLPPYTLHCVVFAGWNQVGKIAEAASVQAAPIQSPPSNAICTNAEGRIVTAFRSPQMLINTQFTLRPSGTRPLSAFPPETPLRTALSQSDMMLGKYYTKEVLVRLGLEGAEMLGASDIQANIEDILLVAEDVRRECLSAASFLLLRPDVSTGKTKPAQTLNKPLLSLLHLTNSRVEREFASVSEAIQARMTTERREARFYALAASAQTRLNEVLTKTERALEHIERDTSGGERAIERQVWAELLLSQPNVQQKGMDAITVEDWEGNTLEIRINPALSLRENAEEYFAKATRAKDAIKKRETRKRQFATEIERLRGLQAKLVTATTESDCERIMSDLQKNTPNAPQHQKTTRFREFPLDEAHTLYVGKAAADNDELTLHFAKPQDYWFHARGVAGSHAVLRSPNKDKKPPKHILEQAASIAAYFSKARNAKMTPVAFTQKKYVRKPKGSAVGAVVIEREEVIMVRPHVPAGLLNSAEDD
jgi:predicted ribosome quality control (RQC) complex YloA/Tae2 family protein